MCVFPEKHTLGVGSKGSGLAGQALGSVDLPDMPELRNSVSLWVCGCVFVGSHAFCLFLPSSGKPYSIYC